jgi:hypothetical protein
MPSNRLPAHLATTLRTLPALLVLLCLACGEDSGDEDRTAPPAPRMRLKSCGDPAAVWPESGVDADASSGQGVRLEWDMDVEPEDLAAFQIFRAWHPDSAYERLLLDEERFLEGHPPYYLFIDLDPGLRPTYHVGNRAWYYVKAMDGDGNTSAPSDTVSYRLWAAPRIFESQVRVQSDTLQVEWQYEFVDMFQVGFRGFTLLITDEQGNLEATREIRLNLEPAMRARYAVGDLGLSPGSHRLRVDTIIETVAQIDSVYVHVASNPAWCTLAGSESNWISFTF